MAGVLLWENPNPTAAMSATTITLASADYDYYEVYYKAASSSNIIMYQRSAKGYGCYLFYLTVGDTGGVSISRRPVIGESDTVLAVRVATTVVGTGQPATSNTACIPVKIIGYKS